MALSKARMQLENAQIHVRVQCTDSQQYPTLVHVTFSAPQTARHGACLSTRAEVAANQRAFVMKMTQGSAKH